MPKRHCLSHTAGGASCAAWQFRPRGTHRVGLFSLDFLWFFLVSRQERTLKMTLYQNSAPGPSFQTYSAPSGLVKIVRSIQGAAPLAIYSAPSGLKPPGKFCQVTYKFRQQSSRL